MPAIHIKRIYAPVEAEDGFRILVDRLWPRGIKKEAAPIDVCLKEVAPSDELRKWFNHEVAKWKTFHKEYEAELQNSDAVNELRNYLKEHSTVTFVYAAKDEEHKQAIVLKKFLEDVDGKNGDSV